MPLTDHPTSYAPRSIVGFAIVSRDGMLADSAGVMPDALKCEADQRFFAAGLDQVDVVIHGRHSHEHQKHSPLRKRLIVTHQIRALERAGHCDRQLRWNPRGASLETALAALEAPHAALGIVGATDVFGLFLDRYDAFHLTRGPDIQLSGGRPVFPGVPHRAPEDVLAAHGLAPLDTVTLDTAVGLTVTTWWRTLP